MVTQLPITQNISKNINQYTTDVVNNHKTNSSKSKKHVMILLMVFVCIHTIQCKHVSKTTKLFSFNDRNYCTQKIGHTSNMTNDITGHNHNNYEHNGNTKVNRHIKHISSYDTEINYYSKTSFNKKNYSNFCNGIVNFRKECSNKQSPTKRYYK